MLTYCYILGLIHGPHNMGKCIYISTSWFNQKLILKCLISVGHGGVREQTDVFACFWPLDPQVPSRKTVKTTEQNARPWGSGDVQFSTLILLMRKPEPWALNWLTQYLTDGSPGNRTKVSIPPALFLSTHSSIKLWGTFEPKPQRIPWHIQGGMPNNIW